MLLPSRSFPESGVIANPPAISSDVRPERFPSMQTQVMHEPAVGTPWLEYYPSAAGPPRRCYLESFPFTIGRHEATDLQINSSRVSREHARILHEDGAYRVKDLGSTNGTFLNGQRIEQSVLNDGDLLVVADVELTFFLGQATPTSAVTQVLGSESEDANRETPTDLICELRRMHQTLTLCSLVVAYQPIVELAGGQSFAFEALDDHGGPEQARAAAARRLLECECRVTGRLRHLRRLIAAEQSRGLPSQADLFLPIDGSEMGTARLAESLGALADVVGNARRLVVGIPQTAVCDLPHFREFCSRMRELGIAMAYDDISAAQMRVLETKDIRPDFLKLAPSLVRNLHRNRQREGEIRSLVQSGEALGCEIIAVGVESEAEANACREAGCRLGQGTFFSPPHTALDN